MTVDLVGKMLAKAFKHPRRWNRQQYSCVEGRQTYERYTTSIRRSLLTLEEISVPHSAPLYLATVERGDEKIVAANFPNGMIREKFFEARKHYHSPPPFWQVDLSDYFLRRPSSRLDPSLRSDNPALRQ